MRVTNTVVAISDGRIFSGERILNNKPAYYWTLEEPDLWFSPELVWEIRGVGKS